MAVPYSDHLARPEQSAFYSGGRQEFGIPLGHIETWPEDRARYVGPRVSCSGGCRRARVQHPLGTADMFHVKHSPDLLCRPATNASANYTVVTPSRAAQRLGGMAPRLRSRCETRE